MPTEQQLIGALRQADAAGDTDGAHRIAGMIKAQRDAAPKSGAIAGMPDFGDAGNAALAAGLHYVHQIPLLGDAVLTGARELADARNGEGFVPIGQANAEVHQVLDSAKEQHRIASTVGGVVGGGLGLAAGGEALDAASGGRLALKAAQPVTNTARLAAGGAIYGGALGAGDAALKGGNASDVASAGVGGAIIGGVTGPAAAGIGRGGVAIARRFAPLSAKTALALSKVFGENAADVQALWNQHITETGRAPSLAELTNYKQQGVLQGFAKNHSTIADALNKRAEQAALARSDNMQSGFSTGMQRQFPPTGAASPAELSNARTAQGDVDYPAARAFHFNVDTAPDAALGGVSPADHIAAEILPQAGLGRADRVRIHNGLQSGHLSGQDAQLLRSGLSESLSRNYSPAVKGYLADLEGFLSAPGNEDANTALQQATQHFAENSQRVEGAQHGAGILGSETPAGYAATAEAKPNANGEFAQGMQFGANDKLAAASATPQGATSLAQRLATDDALHQKLATTFDENTAEALRRMGEAETASAKALSPYRGAPSPEDDKQGLKDAAQVVAAVASHGTWWKAYHAAKVLVGIDMPDSVQAKVAGYLADPKMAKQGINLLAKAGASAQQIRRVALTAAASGGEFGGDYASSNAVPESQP